jgi:hypothetical protein
MVLRSLVATYQRCSVSPKAGRSTYIPTEVKDVLARAAMVTNIIVSIETAVINIMVSVMRTMVGSPIRRRAV